MSELKLLYTCVDDSDPDAVDNAACDGEAVGITTQPATRQMTIGDISSGKNLKDKMAGNDATGQHQDWNTVGLVGWTPGITPEGLLYAWFEMVEAAAQRKVNGDGDTYGGVALPVHVSKEGHDLQQLTQKFLLGAVAFSQGADDYLDYDIEDKGLLADNVGPDKPGSTYTSLEHQWDEGFGYFGAARDYLEYTDDEIAGKAEMGRQGYHDTNADDAVDLAKEYNWGHSINAAKRIVDAAPI